MGCIRQRCPQSCCKSISPRTQRLKVTALCPCTCWDMAPAGGHLLGATAPAGSGWTSGFTPSTHLRTAPFSFWSCWLCGCRDQNLQRPAQMMKFSSLTIPLHEDSRTARLNCNGQGGTRSSLIYEFHAETTSEGRRLHVTLDTQRRFLDTHAHTCEKASYKIGMASKSNLNRKGITAVTMSCNKNSTKVVRLACGCRCLS